MTKSRDINWNIILFPRVSYLIRGRGMTVLNLLTAEPFISRHFYYMYYKQEYMYSHCLSLFSQPTSETREWFSFISGVKGVNKSTFLEFERGTKNKEKIHFVGTRMTSVIRVRFDQMKLCIIMEKLTYNSDCLWLWFWNFDISVLPITKTI